MIEALQSRLLALLLKLLARSCQAAFYFVMLSAAKHLDARADGMHALRFDAVHLFRAKDASASGLSMTMLA